MPRIAYKRQADTLKARIKSNHSDLKQSEKPKTGYIQKHFPENDELTSIIENQRKLYDEMEADQAIRERFEAVMNAMFSSGWRRYAEQLLWIMDQSVPIKVLVDRIESKTAQMAPSTPRKAAQNDEHSIPELDRTNASGSALVEQPHHAGPMHSEDEKLSSRAQIAQGKKRVVVDLTLEEEEEAPAPKRRMVQSTATSPSSTQPSVKIEHDILNSGDSTANADEPITATSERMSSQSDAPPNRNQQLPTAREAENMRRRLRAIDVEDRIDRRELERIRLEEQLQAMQDNTGV